MSDPELKDAILKLTNLIATQQEQIAALQRANANPSGSENTIESLATAIEEFLYDPDDGIFFDAWFARYEDVFKEDGKKLDDKAKVRLLLRKIVTQFHERYVNSILPKHPRDFGFDATVSKLKKLFGRQTSLFHARYQCLQYAKNEADDFSSYAASVNRHCEAFQLTKLSNDQFKALRFVCGLQSPRDAEIRTRLISKLEAEEANPQQPAQGAAPRLTLENLVEECHRIINLKQDTQLVEKTEKLNIHAVAKQPRPTAMEKKVPSPRIWWHPRNRLDIVNRRWALCSTIHKTTRPSLQTNPPFWPSRTSPTTITAQSPPKVFPDSIIIRHRHRATSSSLPIPVLAPTPAIWMLILGWWPCEHSGSCQRRLLIESLQRLEET